MPHTIVILGAGFAGIPVAHSLLKHTPSSTPIRVLLVAPNDAFFFHNASVRSVIPGAQPDSAVFAPIADGFAQYPASRFRHISASATSVDPDHKTVTLSGPVPHGVNTTCAKNIISYDTLVVATGSSFLEDMPFKNVTTTSATKAKLEEIRGKVGAAKDIVVAGAGMTGTEVAGELGAAYKDLKTIHLVADDDLPLNKDFLHSLRTTLAGHLKSLKVNVIPSSRVVKTEVVKGTQGNAAQTKLTLRTKDGEEKTMTTDLYIPTFGTVPNTSFLPTSLLDKTKRVLTRDTFQAEGYDDIFALGDASNLQSASAKHVNDQFPQLAQRLRERIVDGKKELTPWKKDDTIMAGISVGPARGRARWAAGGCRVS